MDHEIKYPEVSRDNEVIHPACAWSLLAFSLAICGIWLVGLWSIVGWIAEALR